MGKFKFWSSEPPTKPGYYWFRCNETPEPEIVTIQTRRKDPGYLFALSDGLWNELSSFHYGLTDSEWQEVNKPEED